MIWLPFLAIISSSISGMMLVSLKCIDYNAAMKVFLCFPLLLGILLLGSQACAETALLLLVQGQLET